MSARGRRTATARPGGPRLFPGPRRSLSAEGPGPPSTFVPFCGVCHGSIYGRHARACVAALWRGRALGTYRYWRDTGYAIGALTLGVVNKFLEPYAGAVLGKILVLVFIIMFIQRRPRGLFALKGRSVE